MWTRIIWLSWEIRERTWISAASWDMSASLPRSFCSEASNSFWRPVFACTHSQVEIFEKKKSYFRVLFENVLSSYQPSRRLWNEKETKNQNSAWNKTCKYFTSEYFADVSFVIGSSSPSYDQGELYFCLTISHNSSYIFWIRNFTN